MLPRNTRLVPLLSIVVVASCADDPEMREAPDGPDGSVTAPTAPTPPPAPDAPLDGAVPAPPSIDGGVTVTVERYTDILCAPQARAYCAARVTCGCGEALSTSECERRWIDRCATAFVNWAGGADVSAMIDPVEAAQCVEQSALGFAACERNLPDACYYVLRPPEERPRGLGDACVSYCEGDAVCIGGTCAPLGADGDACALSGDCDATRVCVDGTCRPRGVEGAECRADGLAPTPCAPGLGCIAGRCTPLPTTCTVRSECGDRRWCQGTPDPRCRPRAAIGEGCFTAVLGERACVDGAHCNRDGVCEPLPVAGDACFSEEGSRCAPGLACVRGTCGAVPGEGERCGEGEVRCGVGLRCEGSRCRPLPGAGEPCPDRVCAAGLSCSPFLIRPTWDGGVYEDRCQELAGPPPCGSDTECGHGSYCDPATGSCSALRGLGDWCSDGDECVAGAACVGGVCLEPPRLRESCDDRFPGSCGADAYCAQEVVGGTCAGEICVLE